MQPRWVVGMWTVAGAALLGVLIAAGSSSSPPPWWVLAVLVVLLVALPAAVTLGARLLRRPSHPYEVAIPYGRASAAGVSVPETRQRSVAPSASASAPRSGSTGTANERTPSGPIAQEDWDALSDVCCALGRPQLDWFRSHDFVTPWLDFHARPVAELEPLVADLIVRPFEDDLLSSLERLSHAIHAFVVYYDANTFPDPLLLGADWRFFEWDNRGPADESASVDELWGGRPVNLQELAAAFLHAYEELTVIAAQNPKVRQRIETRT